MLRLTNDGQNYLKYNGSCWRCMMYFRNVYSLDIPDNKQTFYYAGKSFGSFVNALSDLPADKVYTTIRDFHDTEKRYQALEEAISRDPIGRVKGVREEIEFVRSNKKLYGMISRPLEAGEIPTRITHNDTNLNNILFDNETHLPVAIIDIDTVMPSSLLYDFGDSIRIGTNTAKDDEHDLSKVRCDLELYEEYTRGWLDSCGDIMTKKELELLPYAAIIITSEDGIRFLTDHINGDTYYRIEYPKQNLYRARTQLKMVRDMAEKMAEIKDMFRRQYRLHGIDPENRGGG